MTERFYITTPIYYVNAEPHVGHAYTTIMADILARHHRQRGDDVFFLTGTDEHGTKIARAAEAAGRDPRTHADALSQRFRDLVGTVGASPDFFIRTTDEGHKTEVQRICDELRAKGDIYKANYGGWYCTPCELFYAEDELGDGHECPIHGTPAEWTEEENWFFRLSNYREQLLQHYDENPDFIQPKSRFNEARRIIEDRLEDFSISRSRISWGVPFSWDPEQVVYVWVDALLNYWTALTYARPGENLEDRYWPPTVQLLGKDILKFHAVFWPGLLFAARPDPARLDPTRLLPKRLFIHGFILKGGEKMSKTTGNTVDPFPFIERYGIDALRYYLASAIGFGEDGTFTQEGFEQRYQSELANEFGNLLNRTVSMIARYLGGHVPATPAETAITSDHKARVGEVVAAMNRYDIRDMLFEVWTSIRALNRFVEAQAPWKLAKDGDPLQDEEELAFVLAVLAEGVRIIAILLWPVMPGSCGRALAQLGQPADEPSLRLERAEWGRGQPGATVGAAAPLFPRVEPDEPE